MIVPTIMRHVFAPIADPDWVIVVDGCDSLHEPSVESRFAISNGFLGVRGTRSTTRGGRWVVPARTYVAGLFDASGADHATRGLIPAADWLRVRILLADGPLLHHPRDVSSHRMTLDMRRGALFSEGRHLRAPDLGLHVHTSRLVSLSDRAIGLQLIRLNIEDGELDVTSRGVVRGDGTRPRHRPARSGSWSMAHPAFGEAHRHRDRRGAAGRRSGYSLHRPRPTEIVVDLAISPWASCLLPAVRCHRTWRHRGSGSRQGGPGEAEPSARPGLARRGGGARDGLVKPLAVQRGGGRWRC